MKHISTRTLFMNSIFDGLSLIYTKGISPIRRVGLRLAWLYLTGFQKKQSKLSHYLGYPYCGVLSCQMQLEFTCLWPKPWLKKVLGEWSCKCQHSSMLVYWLKTLIRNEPECIVILPAYNNPFSRVDSDTSFGYPQKAP